MPSVSVVIPYRYENDERHRVYEWCLARWLCLAPDWEIVTPHDGETEGPFSRARAVNRGAEIASGDVLLIADADTCVYDGQGDEMVATLEAGAHWVVGYERMVHLTDEYSIGVLDHRYDVPFANPFGRQSFIRWSSTRSVCGLVGLWRADYQTIGGNDERFRGWGYEDTAFAAKANTLLGDFTRTSGDCLHLFHGLRHDRKQDDEARANRQLGRRYDWAVGDPEAMTSLVRESLGA